MVPSQWRQMKLATGGMAKPPSSGWKEPHPHAPTSVGRGSDVVPDPTVPVVSQGVDHRALGPRRGHTLLVLVVIGYGRDRSKPLVRVLPNLARKRTADIRDERHTADFSHATGGHSFAAKLSRVAGSRSTQTR